MKFIVSFHKWKLMNAWTHLISQLQHIFYCFQSFPAALNHLTWSLFCVLANGHHLLLSFTTSCTPSPEVCPCSLCLGTLKFPYMNSCLLFLMVPQLPTAGLGSAEEGFTAISCLGMMLRLSQTLFFTNPNPISFPTQLVSTKCSRYSYSTSPKQTENWVIEGK